MGWFSDAWKKVKKVFKKVTKVVKKVVKGVGKVAKKVWNGVKSTAKKFGEKISKLGPVANIAMGMIPGFGQLWAAYGVWGAMAKGAITGYLTSGGNLKGALLGAAGGGLGYGYNKLPGTSLSEKISNAFKLGEGTDTLTNSFANHHPQLIGLSDSGGSHYFDSKTGTIMQGKAPGTNQMMGRSSDAYGFAEVDLNKQLQDTGYWADRQAGIYNPNADYAQMLTGVDANAAKHQKRLDRTPVDKLADGLGDFFSGQSSKGKDYQVPAGTYDTSALNQYAINSAGTKGQVGMGTDTYDVTTLGLLDKRKLIEDASRQFLT